MPACLPACLDALEVAPLGLTQETHLGKIRLDRESAPLRTVYGVYSYLAAVNHGIEIHEIHGRESA